MNKGKVCHVISGYYRNDPRVFQRQCKSLKEAGFSVSILTNDDQPDEILDGIPIYSTNNYWGSRMKILLFAKKQFLQRAIEIDADIYQMHSPELLSLGIELQKRGKVVVYDAHEDLPKHILEKDWLPQLARKPLSVIVEAYMNKMLKKYDGIVSPHSHVVDALKLINNNTVLITNFAKVLPREEVSQSDYMKRDQVICYSGTVYLHSNQVAILDAIKDMPEVTYNIAGYMTPEYQALLSQHVAYPKINYIGRIPWADLQGFYNQARIGVVIIDYKMNLGQKRGTYAVNKMFEYMEAALPVVCTDYDLWKDIVDEFNCGICVQPGNVEEIKKAITYLLSNPDQAYQMGQNGRRAILEKFNWKTQHEVYVELFSKF